MNRMKVRLGFFLSVLLLMSCSDYNIPIKLEFENYYEFPLGKAKIVRIQGSGDYQVVVADTTILNVSFHEINQLSILPINKGETEFVVFDKVSGESAKAKVKITDSYFSFSIGNPQQLPFCHNESLFFVRNTSNDLLIFKNDSILLNKGHYVFEKIEQNFKLKIQFSKEYNGYKELVLVLKNNSDFINQFLEEIISNQDSITNSYNSRFRSGMPTVMNAVDTNTGKKYYFVLSDKVVPYYVLP